MRSLLVKVALTLLGKDEFTTPIDKGEGRAKAQVFPLTTGFF